MDKTVFTLSVAMKIVSSDVVPKSLIANELLNRFTIYCIVHLAGISVTGSKANFDIFGSRINCG